MLYILLLSDAKISKNIPQDLVSGNLSDNRAEVIDCFAYVLGGEVGRETSGETFADAEEGSAGVCQGLGVALVRHKCRVTVSEEIVLSCGKEDSQSVCSEAGFCRNRYDFNALVGVVFNAEMRFLKILYGIKS